MQPASAVISKSQRRCSIQAEVLAECSLRSTAIARCVPLLAAAIQHAVTIMLLVLGVDNGYCRDLALSLAARNGHLETVAVLLDHGADAWLVNSRQLVPRR